MTKSVLQFLKFILILYVLILILMSVPLREYILGGLYSSSDSELITYIKYHTNIFPLSTMLMYIEKIKQNTINTVYIIKIIVGNITLFIPLGALLKMFFETKKVIVYSLCCAVTMEILQLVTRSGSFDIDIIILRFLGAMFGFAIVSLVLKLKRGAELRRIKFM